jgi:ribosome recycling factor
MTMNGATQIDLSKCVILFKPIYMTDLAVKGKDIIAHFQTALKSIRTGLVTSSVLDSIHVEVYGSNMKIAELAVVQTRGAREIIITPFDKSVLTAIEKAIRDSNLGVNPVNDGAGLILNFPAMTQEDRVRRVDEVDDLLEQSRISVRQVRGDIHKGIHTQKEEGSLSEDDAARFDTELQKDVDHLNKELEEIAKAKKADLLKL